MEFVVDDREQLVECTLVAIAPGAEQGRQFVVPGRGALVHLEGCCPPLVYCRARAPSVSIVCLSHLLIP